MRILINSRKPKSEGATIGNEILNVFGRLTLEFQSLDKQLCIIV